MIYRHPSGSIFFLFFGPTRTRGGWGVGVEFYGAISNKKTKKWSTLKLAPKENQ